MARNTQNKEETGEHTVIVPPKSLPWYKKILRALHLTSDTQIYLGVLLFLVTGFAVAWGVRYWQSMTTHAGTNTVKISVQPATSTMPPNTTYQLWVTADNPVAFATIKITFDPKLVKLIGEIATAPSPLTRIVKQTAMSEANTTGVIQLSMGLDPTKRATPPTGTFELATIPMAPNTTTQNLSATIHLDSSSMQVINPDSTIFTITTADANVALNPPPTPTPTLTPTPSPTPKPTPTPTPATQTGTTITNIKTSVTATTGKITWKTSTPTTGNVMYGAASNALTGQTPVETVASTTHTVTITGLTANSWTYYQITGTDASGISVTSSVNRFKTRAK